MTKTRGQFVNQERFEANPVAPLMTLAGLQHQEQPVTAVIIIGHTHTHTHTKQECVDKIQTHLVLN